MCRQKNTAFSCITARKSPRNGSLPLAFAIHILRKMPRKSDESSVECCGHGFLIAGRPSGVYTENITVTGCVGDEPEGAL